MLEREGEEREMGEGPFDGSLWSRRGEWGGSVGGDGNVLKRRGVERDGWGKNHWKRAIVNLPIS